ncbi:MAG: hypothetical protein RLZZ450_7597 [Pseudomonadota bacterium]|jgi:hypothetical protein
MDALKTVSLALAVAIVGTACGDDDKPTTKIDAGVDASVVISDGGGGTDAATRPCTSYTPVADGRCGGSHCTQTESDVKASAIANATCGGDVEIKSFCSLEAVNVVAQCTRNSLSSLGDDVTFSNAITACATTPSAQNPKVVPAGFSSTCLSCFVDSAKCAAKECLVDCAANDKTAQCDDCRIAKGCIGSFYQCAGITNPLDLLAAAQDAGLLR